MLDCGGAFGAIKEGQKDEVLHFVQDDMEGVQDDRKGTQDGRGG